MAVCFFGYKENNLWVAFCIDLNLAVQADTLKEAQQKIVAMAVDYLYEAIEGEDKHYQSQLLARKAPFSIRLKYYLIYIRNLFSSMKLKFFQTLSTNELKQYSLSREACA